MTNDIELTAESWTVSATETVSKAEYEPFKVHTSVSGSVGGDGRLDEATRRELRARLLAVHKAAQATVERAAENRIAAKGHENWGVSCDE